MKKNISYKEGLLNWLKMSEEDFYAHPAYQDQNHPETHKMLAAYEQFRSGGNLPKAQNGLQTYSPNFNIPATSQDSVRNEQGNTFNYETVRGSKYGTGISNQGYYQDINQVPLTTDKQPKNSQNEYTINTVQDAITQAKEYDPYLSNFPSAVEKGEAFDFKYNTGKDARIYAYQEYLRKTDPNNLTGWQDADGNWKDRKNPVGFDKLYNDSVGKLGVDSNTGNAEYDYLHSRRKILNTGRDWYYKNTYSDKLDPKTGQYSGIKGVDYWDKVPDGKGGFTYTRGADGSLSPAYGKTWYGRIHNTNKYESFNPNNPKFTKKEFGGFLDPTKPWSPTNLDGYYGQTGYKVPTNTLPVNPFGSVNTMPLTNGVNLLEQAKKWNSNEKNIRMNPSMIEYTPAMRAQDSLMNKLFPRKMALGGNIYGDVGDSTQGDQGQYLTQYQQEMQQLQDANQNNTNTLNQYNQGVQGNIQQQEDNYVDPMTAVENSAKNAEIGTKVANTAIDIFGKKTAEELAKQGTRLSTKLAAQQGTKTAAKTAGKLAANQAAQSAASAGTSAGTTAGTTAATAGTSAAMSAAAIGLPIVGEGINQGVRALTPDRQVDGQKYERTGAIIGGDTAKWAGMGAGIGSAFGPIGTGIGAGVGAIGGFVGGLIQSSGNNKKYKQALERSTLNRNRESMDSYDPINIGKQGLPGYQMGGRLSEYEMGGNLGNTKSIINSYFDPMFGLPEYAVGGNISKAQSNDLVSIGGEYHENGGTPVNSLGQAVDEEYAVAEAEKGEASRNGYIYSDTLGVDKNGNPTGNDREVKTTYAKLAKSINKKYNSKEDALGIRTKEFEYGNLKEKSEISRKLKEQYDQQKAVQAFDRYQKKYGGLIRYDGGGPTKPWGQMTPAERFAIQNQYSSYLGVPKEQGDLFGGLKQNLMYPYSGNPGVIPSTNTGTPPQIFVNPGTPVTPPFLGALPPVRTTIGNGFDPWEDPMQQGANPDSIQGNQPIPPPPYQYPQPTEKEYRDRELSDAIAQGNIWNGGISNPNQSTSGKDDYPYVQGYEYNKQPGWGTNPQVTPPIPNQVMFGQEPKRSKTEVPPIGNNIDYYGLGLATIPHLIDAAIASKKDDNRYYPNEKAGLARRDISNLSTDVNIDAALAQNTRDSRAAMKAVENRNPSTANSINSQMLTNKLYANNKLYEGKYNTEKALEKEKGFALSNLDYTSGETDRRERIAEEDKNIANRSRRQDILRKNIEDTAKDLNTLRNEKIGYGGINDALKYGQYNTKTGKWEAKKGVNPYYFDAFIETLTPEQKKELEKKQ